MKPAHYMIQVRSLADAIAFYERALGLAVVDRHEYQGAMLVYMRPPEADFELELVAPNVWPFKAMPEAGRTHMAFTVDDLETEHDRLTKLGINPDPVSHYVANGVHQTRFFYFTDPEGNQIEFLEPCGRYADHRRKRPCSA